MIKVSSERSFNRRAVLTKLASSPETYRSDVREQFNQAHNQSTNSPATVGGDTAGGQWLPEALRYVKSYGGAVGAANGMKAPNTGSPRQDAQRAFRSLPAQLRRQPPLNYPPAYPTGVQGLLNGVILRALTGDESRM